MAWSTQVEGTDAVAREVLARELVWNAYPLGNFGEPYRPFMSVMHASSLDRRHATCVLFRHPDFAVVVPAGAVDGVEAILASFAATLPTGAELMIMPEHVPAFERRFAIEPIEWMVRVHVTAECWRPQGQVRRVAPLGRRDLPELTALYAEGAMPYYAEQVNAGFFFGVRHGERLVAAAGTHNFSEACGVAALGSLYVHPKERRAGLGRELTIARVEALFAAGFRDVVANIGIENEASLELHDRLGFARSCRFMRATLRELVGRSSV